MDSAIYFAVKFYFTSIQKEDLFVFLIDSFFDAEHKPEVRCSRSNLFFQIFDFEVLIIFLWETLAGDIRRLLATIYERKMTKPDLTLQNQT